MAFGAVAERLLCRKKLLLTVRVGRDNIPRNKHFLRRLSWPGASAIRLKSGGKAGHVFNGLITPGQIRKAAMASGKSVYGKKCRQNGSGSPTQNRLVEK
jgi:hypothetical protein